MTREQLIREMIQIELLYQTRQKILKEHNSALSGGNAINAPANSTGGATGSTGGSNITTYDYDIGNNNSNVFIQSLDSLKNAPIKLYSEYKDATGKKIKSITELTYEMINDPGINSVNFGKKDQNIQIIWEFFQEVLTSQLLISYKAAKSITEIFKQSDIAKKGKVFEIFEVDFPLQSFSYNSAADIKLIVEHINKNVSNPLYQAIYGNKDKDENQTFSTGKGEFLCVLLTKDAVSGGVTQLDVSVGNRSYDIKQTTNSNSTLNFTLSSKSGVRKFKNDFVKAYERLAQKLYEISDELLKLDVDPDIIQTIQDFEGYVGSDFKSDSTTQRLQQIGAKKTKIPKVAKSQKYGMDVKTTPTKASILPTYVAFGDITEALKQGIAGLKFRSYDNTMEFNNIINSSLKNKYRTSEFNDTNLTQNLSINTTNNSINYTPIDKIRNIDPITIEYLNNILKLNIQTFNQNNDFFEKENSDWLVTNTKKQLNSATGSTATKTKFLFKIFETIKYNQEIDQKIQSPYNDFFKLDKDFPIIVFDTKGTITSLSDITDFFDGIKAYINNNNIDVTKSPQFKIFKDIENHVNSLGRADDKKNLIQSYYEQLKTGVIGDLFNNQILLTDNQMVKINNFIKINQQTVQGLTKASKNMYANTVINGEYVVAEPLQQTDNDGEFIIDISFYKNKKKRHIDTLHSQDFKIINSTDQQITKKNKSAEIANLDPTKIVDRVNIELDDVISDKKMIDQKLKEFNLFNNLQPGVLDKIFLRDPNNNTNQYKLKPLKDYQGNQISYDTNKEDIKKISQKEKNKFINDLKFLKEKTKEENILNILYDLYVGIDELETQIMDYYYINNDVVVINEDNKLYTNATDWGAVTFPGSYNFEIGFITDINNEGVTCNADAKKPVQTVKELIRNTFSDILELMLDVQATVRK